MCRHSYHSYPALEWRSSKIFWGVGCRCKSDVFQRGKKYFTIICCISLVIMSPYFQQSNETQLFVVNLPTAVRGCLKVDATFLKQTREKGWVTSCQSHPDQSYWPSVQTTDGHIAATHPFQRGWHHAAHKVAEVEGEEAGQRQEKHGWEKKREKKRLSSASTCIQTYSTANSALNLNVQLAWPHQELANQNWEMN